MRGGRIVGVVLTGLLVGCATSSPADEPGPVTPEPTIARSEMAVEEAFVRAIAASRAEDFATASEEMAWIAAVCPGTEVEAKALLSLLALEVDPRNERGDPAVARRLAERYLELDRAAGWTGFPAEALYLYALHLGAADEETAPEDAGEPEAASESAEGSREDGGEGAKTTISGTHGTARGEGEILAGEEGRPDSHAAVEYLRKAGQRPRPAAGVYSCESSILDTPYGRSRPPVLADTALSERLRLMEEERSNLRQQVGLLERQLAELRQELERIRATLRP